MKFLRIVLLIIVLVFSVVPEAAAQTPIVKIYFDAEFNADYAFCPDAPSGTVVDTMYVVALNFDMWINAVEYQILFPPSMMFLADWVDNSALTIASSPAGIWIAWTVPQSAFEPFLLQKVIFIWRCSDCEGINETVSLVEFPYSGMVRAIRWPDNETVLGVGSTAGICFAPPRETTWGQIKALYE